MTKTPLRLLLLLSLVAAGCGDKSPPVVRKLPRPVTTLKLRAYDPSSSTRVTGSVASWKTEQIGFEVAGRVQFVIEPETDIQGHMLDTEQNVLTEGTPLASIDSTRYELRVNSAQAQILTAQKQREALEIEIQQVIPAQQRSAEAEVTFQQSEIQRITPLVQSGAVARAEYDRTVADRDSALAKAAQIVANQQARMSELASLDAQIQELRQSLADAERDVAECRLVSSFRGQVAEVHVVPGAMVNTGQPVVTVQMMDPIKVEFEVSSATTRSLNYSDLIPVYVNQHVGPPIQMNGYLYMVDPVADPETRTFTVTLLLQNGKTQLSLPAELQGKNVARVDGLRKVVDDVDGRDGALFVDVDAIYEDAEGAYLWKITNRALDAGSRNPTGPFVNVKKVRIHKGPTKIPMLGIWTLQEIQLADGQEFNVERDIIARKILSASSEPWNGDTLMLDQQRWLLRPGDLVSVDINSEHSPPGFYVPMDAILQQQDRDYVYVVAGDGDVATAKRVEVTVGEGPDTLKRIAATGEPLADGTQLIVTGAHYLQDGEGIRVTQVAEIP